MNALLRSSKQALQHAGRSFASSPHPDRKVALLGAAGGIGQPLGLLLKVHIVMRVLMADVQQIRRCACLFCVCRYLPTSATSHSTISPGHLELLLTSVTSTQRLCAKCVILADPCEAGCVSLDIFSAGNLTTKLMVPGICTRRNCRSTEGC